MSTSLVLTITELELVPQDLFYVTVNGKIVDWKSLNSDAHFQVHFRLRGGKGGFGSLLRSFRIHRSTNQLMCRDLSGRRLADIKEEEKLRKWIEKAEEREEEKRRQKQEKYEKLKAGPQKHDFSDPGFIQTREKIMEETDNAFEQGIAVARNKQSNGESSLKSKQKSKIVEDNDFEKCIVPSKRRRMTTNESLNEELIDDRIKRRYLSAIAVVDEDRKYAGNGNEKELSRDMSSNNEKSAIDVVDKGRKCAGNGNEKELSRTTAVFTAEKTTTSMEEATGKMNFDINLDDYDSAEKLECLGLDCLKHALEVRGLKCGGSISERAVRLYSAKGLKPEQYPKNIRARGK